tara:strand:- start:55 stop:675 length:621 start_codon:yes stop_codon:yes gene_type:complete
MKNSMIVSTFLGLSLLTAFSCKENSEEVDLVKAEDPTEVRQIIESKNKQIETWTKQGLVDSLSSIFADNIIQMPPNQTPIEGIRQFKSDWRENLAQGVWDFNIQTKEVKVCGEMAVERGTFKLDFSPNETAQMPAFTDEGNYVVLWEKIDGNWKIVWDAPVSTMGMESMNAPDTIKDEKMVFTNKSGSRLKQKATYTKKENTVTLK